MDKNTGAQKGFTTVELLLGIALLGILVPSIILGMDAIAAVNDTNKDLAIANIVAENRIEELRSIGFNGVPTGTVDITSSLPATLGRTRSGSYTVTNSTAGLKEVTLTLTIQNRSGTRTLNYRTVIGELGVGQ